MSEAMRRCESIWVGTLLKVYLGHTDSQRAMCTFSTTRSPVSAWHPEMWHPDVGLVVMGHHADDADENRLAELGKGTVADVDGMSVLSVCHGTTLYRPLLSQRKALFYDVARVARVPYMVDSTPLWSRRGCVVHVGDGRCLKGHYAVELHCMMVLWLYSPPCDEL